MYLHYIVVGPESADAAEASECAADQGQFSPYHDLLFENQGPENSNYLTRQRLTGFAQQLGLDTDQFAQCLSSKKHHSRVVNSTNQGASVGVRGTPTVFVDGRMVENPLDVSALRGMILDELAGSP